MTDSSSVRGNIDEPGLYYQARKKKKLLKVWDNVKRDQGTT